MPKSLSQRLRQLIEADEPLVLPYGACALHARMAEAMGFQAVALSGGWASVHFLGHPDAGLISLPELTAIVRAMALRTEIPVIADADQGFGNAVNTFYATQAFVNAGVAGLHIEDQPYPKRCGFLEGKEVVSVEEMVGKLRAARDAAAEMDPDFVIIARVDSLTAAGGGMEETVNRCRAYREEGGADVLYVEGPRSVDEMRTVRESVEGPLFCSLNAVIPHPSEAELRDLGQCIIQLAELICEPAIIASWDLLHRYREQGMPAWNAFMDQTTDHSLARLRHFDLVGFPKIREIEERYLPQSQMAKYGRSPGLYGFER